MIPAKHAVIRPRAALVASLKCRSRAAYQTTMILMGATMILLVMLMVAFTGESHSQVETLKKGGAA